jgi:metallophosphoesterase superfamily enzyme
MTDLALADGFFATPYRFLWHAPSRTAILSDLHLGVEATLARQGFYLPDTSTAAIRAAWERIVERTPAEVVIAGDLFDAPAALPAALPLFQTLLAALPRSCTVTVLPGNHDPSADALADELDSSNVTVRAAVAVGGYAVFHGHQSADARGLGEGRWTSGTANERHWIPRGIVVGHQHPAVVLRTRVQAAKMLCFAQATLRVDGSAVNLLILPPFSPVPLGSNLLTEIHWILDLPRPADEDVRILGLIEPQGRSPKVLEFGELANINRT